MTRMHLLMAHTSETGRGWGVPFGRLSPYPRSTRLRCARRASRGSAWRRSTEARVALGLGVGAVDLVELVTDAGLFPLWDTGACVAYAHVEVAVCGFGRHPNRTGRKASIRPPPATARARSWP